MTFLHERGASAHDVSSSIGVGVVPMTTSDALEDRLALAASSVNDPTFSARLRRVRSGNVDQSSARCPHFVLKLASEDTPALRQNGAVKATLLRNSTPWLLNRSLCAGGHRADVQIFQYHHPKTRGETRTRYMKMMGPHSRNLRRNTGNGVPLLPISRRSALTSRKNALGPPTSLLHGTNVRQANMLTGRERKRRRYAPVNPNHGRKAQGDVLHIRRKNNVPAPPRIEDRHVHNIAGNLARFPVANPTYAGQPYLRPATIDGALGQVLPCQTDAGVDALLPEKRVPTATKETLKCFVEVAQSIFEAGSRNGSYEIELASECRHLKRLLTPRKVLTSRSFVLTPEITPLLKREIVHKARDADPLTQRLGLFWPWIQSEPEGFVHGHRLAEPRSLIQ